MKEHLFSALTNWAYSKGAWALHELPAPWEHQLGEFLVAMNAADVPRPCSTGALVPPMSFSVEGRGLLVGIVDMCGWTLLSDAESAVRAAIDSDPDVVRRRRKT